MLEPGAKAPDFQLVEIDTGQPFQLSKELENGPVALVFLKESCPTCRYAVPLLSRAAVNSSGPHGKMVVVLQEMPLVARDFVQSMRMQGTLLLDEAPYPVSDSYEIHFVPSAFYIEQDGTIAHAAQSFQRDELALMSEKLALANGLTPSPFYLEEEEVPAFRPG